MLFLSVVVAVVELVPVVIYSSTFELLLQLVHKDTNTVSNPFFLRYWFLHHRPARKMLCWMLAEDSRGNELEEDRGNIKRTKKISNLLTN